MNWQRITVSLLLLFTSLMLHAAQDIYPFSSPAEAARYHQLTNEIRCVVCQGQSIADSNAMLAKDLRKKIYQMVLAQQSNAAIKDYLTQRYGQFILLEPRLSKQTMLLWAFPFAALLFICVTIIVRYLGKPSWRLKKNI